MWQFILFFIVFALFLKKQINYLKPKYFNLSILYGIYWFLFLLFSYLLFQNDYMFNIRSFLWIFIGVLLFSCGYYYMYRTNVKKTHSIKKKKNIDFKIILNIIIFSFLFKICGDIIFLCLNDISLNPDTINNSIKRLIDIRYEMIPATRSIITSLGNVLFYFSILLIGYYNVNINKYRKIKYVIYFLFFVSLLMAVFTTMGKGPLIYSLELFLSGFAINLINKEYYFHKLNKRTITIFSLTVILIVLTFLGITYFRTGTFDNSLESFKLYGFGSIPAFDYYFTHMRNTDLTLGQYTFNALFNMLGIGITNNLQGVYLPIEVGGISTNVFTVFRGLINDFGIYGGLIFQFLLGCFSGFFTKCFKNGKIPKISSSFIVIICAFILEGFVISIGNFLSLSLSCFLFLIMQVIIEIFNVDLKCLEEDGTINE